MVTLSPPPSRARHPRSSSEPAGQSNDGDHPAEAKFAENITANKIARPKNQANCRRRLLLVEDHRDTGAIFRRMLQNEGYDVVLTTSVKSAIALFDMTCFDAVVSDMGLPDGSGLDVMRHILERRPIPAIAVSALSSDADVERSLAAGFRAHLPKPIDLPRLKELLAQLTGEPEAAG